jgi:hypothetical protein
MLYNVTHKVSKIIEPPSQEDIYNCPHYFAMSYDQVKQSGAPQFLINLLDQFPFDGRKNVLQIRPQDFRNGNNAIDGAFWHCDDSVRLLDSAGNTISLFAKDEFDWHLMVISWGAGCKTQFMDSPIELNGSIIDQLGSIGQLQARLQQPYDIMTVEKNQMVEYTSRDVHRADGICHSSGLRLMIVAFDCSHVEGNVRVLPTIRELDGA